MRRYLWYRVLYSIYHCENCRLSLLPKAIFLIMPLLGLVFLISFVPTIVLAQEVEETEYSWGTVTSVSSKQIIITEYDSDEETDVAYTLAPNVKLDNANSLKDIAIGDEVWIDYVVKEGKKVVVSIEVKKSSDEEYTPFEEESDTSEE